MSRLQRPPASRGLTSQVWQLVRGPEPTQVPRQRGKWPKQTTPDSGELPLGYPAFTSRCRGTRQEALGFVEEAGQVTGAEIGLLYSGCEVRWGWQTPRSGS